MPIRLATRGKFGDGANAIATWGKIGVVNLIRLIYEKIKRQIFKIDDEYRVFVLDTSYRCLILDNKYRIIELDNTRRIFIKDTERAIF